jgi:flagellar basal-body rod protein FlgC
MSLIGAISVSASALSAQRTRAEVIVENLANSETTRTAEGGPYRRKAVVFGNESVSSFGDLMAEVNSENGVRVVDIVEEDREPILRYQPSHPDANKEGYVAYPNIQPAEDMVDLMSATRGYQANVAAITSVKEMIQRSLDLLR